MVILLAVFLGIAIIKPWDMLEQGRETGAPTPRPVSTMEPTLGAEPSPVEDRGISFGSWQRQIAQQVGSHAEFGVRVIVATSADAAGGIEIEEVWRPIAPGEDGWRPVVGPADEVDGTLAEGAEVVAIGVTTPYDQPALDVRAWRVHDGSMGFMAGPAVVVPGTLDDRLLLPPPEPSLGGTWRPGTYRLEVLLGLTIMPITLDIPGPPDAPPPATVTDPPSDGGLADLFQPDDFGAFAVGDTRDRQGLQLTRLDARPGQALDAPAAWLDLESGLDERSGWRPVDRVSVVGVRAPIGHRFRSATLTRIAPTEMELGNAQITDVSRSAVFRPSESGLAFEPGTYRIDGQWRDARGRARTGSWHVNVYPQYGRSGGPLLDAARRGAPIAGRWAVDGGLRDGPDLQSPNTASVDPAVLGPRCEGRKILPTDPGVVALGYPTTQDPPTMLARLFDGPDSSFVPAIIANVAPGLVVMAPGTGEEWDEGYFAAMFTEFGARLVFCVGHFDSQSQLTVRPGADEPDSLE